MNRNRILKAPPKTQGEVNLEEAIEEKRVKDQDKAIKNKDQKIEQDGNKKKEANNIMRDPTCQTLTLLNQNGN